MRLESRDALLAAIAKARGWIDDIRLGCNASFAEIAERKAQGGVGGVGLAAPPLSGSGAARKAPDASRQGETCRQKPVMIFAFEMIFLVPQLFLIGLWTMGNATGCGAHAKFCARRRNIAWPPPPAGRCSCVLRTRRRIGCIA
jgi:hypothetical protein